MEFAANARRFSERLFSGTKYRRSKAPNTAASAAPPSDRERERERERADRDRGRYLNATETHLTAPSPPLPISSSSTREREHRDVHTRERSQRVIAHSPTSQNFVDGEEDAQVSLQGSISNRKKKDVDTAKDKSNKGSLKGDAKRTKSTRTSIRSESSHSVGYSSRKSKSSSKQKSKVSKESDRRERRERRERERERRRHRERREREITRERRERERERERQREKRERYDSYSSSRRHNNDRYYREGEREYHYREHRRDRDRDSRERRYSERRQTETKKTDRYHKSNSHGDRHSVSSRRKKKGSGSWQRERGKERRTRKERDRERDVSRGQRLAEQGDGEKHMLSMHTHRGEEEGDKAVDAKQEAAKETNYADQKTTAATGKDRDSVSQCSSSSGSSSRRDRPRRKYVLKDKIGSGSFGDVYLGIDQYTGEPVAVKAENRSAHKQLKGEASIYRMLQGGPGIPKYHVFFQHGHWNMLTLQLLGPSLEDLFEKCGNHFSLRTTLLIGDQILQCLKFLHSKNLIHRDIKPANFLIGRDPQQNFRGAVSLSVPTNTNTKAQQISDQKKEQNDIQKENNPAQDKDAVDPKNISYTKSKSIAANASKKELSKDNVEKVQDKKDENNQSQLEENQSDKKEKEKPNPTLQAETDKKTAIDKNETKGEDPKELKASDEKCDTLKEHPQPTGNGVQRTTGHVHQYHKRFRESNSMDTFRNYRSGNHHHHQGSSSNCSSSAVNPSSKSMDSLRDGSNMNHGVPSSKRIYIIDFGLSKPYRDRTTGAHIPYQEGKKLTGTPRYASINCHLGRETSRRDDLESLSYLLVYFLQGRLPWQGLKARNKTEKYNKITERKLCTPIEKLCTGLPYELAQLLSYCKGLGFQQDPDYSYLRGLMRSALERIIGASAAQEALACPTYDWDRPNHGVHRSLNLQALHQQHEMQKQAQRASAVEKPAISQTQNQYLGMSNANQQQTGNVQGHYQSGQHQRVGLQQGAPNAIHRYSGQSHPYRPASAADILRGGVNNHKA